MPSSRTAFGVSYETRKKSTRRGGRHGIAKPMSEGGGEGPHDAGHTVWRRWKHYIGITSRPTNDDDCDSDSV